MAFSVPIKCNFAERISHCIYSFCSIELTKTINTWSLTAVIYIYIYLHCKTNSLSGFIVYTVKNRASTKIAPYNLGPSRNIQWFRFLKRKELTKRMAHLDVTLSKVNLSHNIFRNLFVVVANINCIIKLWWIPWCGGEACGETVRECDCFPCLGGGYTGYTGSTYHTYPHRRLYPVLYTWILPIPSTLSIIIQILWSYILYKYYPSLYYISTFLVG